MSSCTSCGRELDGGRFCTQCGQPVDAAIEAPIQAAGDGSMEAAAVGDAAAARPPDDATRIRPAVLGIAPPIDESPVDEAPDEADDWRTATAERPRVPPLPGLPPGSAPLPPSPLPAPLPAPLPTAPTAPAGSPGSAGSATPRTPPAGPPPPPPPPLPPVSPPPGAPRYPLFADQLATAPATGPVTSPHLTATYHDRSRRLRLGWLTGALALLLVAALGAWLLLGTPDTSTTASDLSADGVSDPATESSTGSSADPTPAPSGTPTPAPTTTTPTAPTASPSPATGDATSPPPSAPPGGGPLQDVASGASARTPATAGPSQDDGGEQTTYAASNMLDGSPRTTWRMPGDGTGDEIVFTLARPTTITTVGLINGYAKSARGPNDGKLDWYTGNRRITAVEWVFDDGSTARQDLDETREMQSIDVAPTLTSTIRLRLLAVTAPGAGRAARDNTAISEVTLFGSPTT